MTDSDLYGSLHVPRSRMKNGKKIDTWRFIFPDQQHADIEVFLRSTPQGVSFLATSDHPLLKELAVEGSDLDSLRKTVAKKAREIASRLTGDNWVPHVIVELKPYAFDNKDRKEFHLEFSREVVLADIDALPNNRRLRTVITPKGRKTVIERGYAETLETDNSLESSNLLRAVDSPAARSVLPMTPDLTEALDALEAVLTGFAAELGAALDPHQLAHSGPPEPRDLIEMMKRSVDRHHLPQGDRDD